MASLLDALAEYVEVLSHSAQTTTHAQDRSAYTSHLAAAAEIFACVQSDRLTEAKEIVRSQQRAYGLGYLSGDEGAAATAAFARLASIFEASRPE